VLALSLGIGVNATVFTFVNAVLIRGLPVANPDDVLALNSRDPVRDRQMGVSYLDFQDWRTATKTFSGLAAYQGTIMNVSEEGRTPERFNGTFISASGFGLLGQTPILGRTFVAEDDRPGAPPVVIIGGGMFTTRYGGDPGVLGRTVRINDVPSVIIGVMPEGFRFPQNADLWQPLALIPDLDKHLRNQRNFEVFGRLAPGATAEQAKAEFAAIGQRLETDFVDTNKNVAPQVQTFNERFNGGPLRTVFLSLMGAVAFVLLIACANVANLLLARSAQRAREIAVRVSIGASRWRIVRQLLMESVLLAVVAGLFGMALAAVGINLFDAATQNVGRPYWIQFTIDWRVISFMAAVCLGTGVLFGLAPALHVSKSDVNEILKEGGRSGSAGIRVRRWTGALIVGEMALTLTLLAGAGFMVRNFFTHYQMTQTGDTSRLLTMQLALPDRKYPAIEQRLAFYQQLQDRLQSSGGIRSVSVTSHVPMGSGFPRQLSIDARPLGDGEQPPNVTMLTVDPQYFETVGLPVVRGRGFTPADGSPGQEFAVINQRFAQMHFSSDDPIGRRITLRIDLAGGAPPAGGIPTTLTATIVGIVPNIRQRDFAAAETDPVAYLPYRMEPRGFMNLLARSDGDPGPVTALVREQLRAIDPDLPLFGIRTLDELLAQQRWPFRIFGAMFAFFAFIALLLSAVGLYAVTSYSVTQRTQEIGVRTALGAASGQVMWLFLRRGLIQTAIGLVVGIAGALGVGKLFESTQLLIQLNGRDPATIGSIAALMAVVALFACVWPARRATTLDPLVALRRE
jgi:predicted permease